MILILATLLMTHLTIVCVTLYLHRSQAHRAVEFHPVISHFMRFWLWLTTGMVTREWVAIHRKHHRYCETKNDPHSPHVWGIGRVLFGGAFLYAQATADRPMIAQYGKGTPTDWIEQHVYTPYHKLGIVLLLIAEVLLFNGWGIVMWLIQMAWIPFWAAGVVNGLGHWWGYRNGNTRDRSRNISPWGIVIGGEELHNNHHLAPASAKLSQRWWEFDIGWMYITVLRWCGLAQLKTQ